MKNKKIDCVKMMRDIRNQLYRETKELTGKEFIQKLRNEFPQLRTKHKSGR